MIPSPASAIIQVYVSVIVAFVIASTIIDTVQYKAPAENNKEIFDQMAKSTSLRPIYNSDHFQVSTSSTAKSVSESIVEVASPDPTVANDETEDEDGDLSVVPEEAELIETDEAD